MKVLVSGSTGLVGSLLVRRLAEAGHTPARLVRPQSSAPEGEAGGEPTVSWDPSAGTIDADGLRALAPEGVVHLAGDNIAEGRWSDAKKRRIRDSRVEGTRILSEALARMETPPRVFVSASAVGYYGDRGDELLTEESAPGSGFLTEVCQEWEAASRALDDAGCRVVRLRIGMILAKDGGALAKMLPPFKAGVGGKVGSGKQYMSWIAVDDVVGIAMRALEDDTLRGAVNTVAPNPVTNAEFTKALGSVLRRPTVFPLPGFMVKVVFGEMGENLLLGGQRVKPAALESAGHRFEHPELEGALRHVLGRG